MKNYLEEKICLPPVIGQSYTQSGITNGALAGMLGGAGVLGYIHHHRPIFSSYPKAVVKNPIFLGVGAIGGAFAGGIIGKMGLFGKPKTACDKKLTSTKSYPSPGGLPGKLC